MKLTELILQLHTIMLKEGNGEVPDKLAHTVIDSIYNE